jgi:hypothetical protein
MLIYLYGSGTFLPSDSIATPPLTAPTVREGGLARPQASPYK